jgi:hypothetical protein
MERPRTKFNRDQKSKDGLCIQCKSCEKDYRERKKEAIREYQEQYRKTHVAEHTAAASKYKASKLKAVPAWFEKEAIEAMYKATTARSKSEGVKYHVDHIIPLQSKFVCGLHCLANFEIVLWNENLTKGNRVWPDMWEITDEHYWLLDAQKDV